MRYLVVLCIVSIGLAVWLGGAAPFGRVLLSLGLNRLASQAFQDEEWTGVAYFRAGDYTAAEEAFDAAGAFYNLGNAAAFNDDPALALESYDRAIAEGVKDAQANFDVVSAYYAGLGIDPEALGLLPERKEGQKADSFIARGDARAAGTGSEVTNTNTMLGLAELDSRGRLGVRRIFDDKFMVADQRWLNQLSDVPGEFMAARIAQEHKRRVKLGLSPPEPETAQ